MVPASDQHAVQKEAEKWAKLWKCGEKYLGVGTLDACCRLEGQLPTLTAKELAAAALTFKERKPSATGLGAHNIPPRAIHRLPTRLLQQLADMLMACE